MGNWGTGVRRSQRKSGTDRCSSGKIGMGKRNLEGKTGVDCMGRLGQTEGQEGVDWAEVVRLGKKQVEGSVLSSLKKNGGFMDLSIQLAKMMSLVTGPRRAEMATL